MLLSDGLRVVQCLEDRRRFSSNAWASPLSLRNCAVGEAAGRHCAGESQSGVAA